MFEEWVIAIGELVPLVLTIAVVVLGLVLINWGLKRHWKDQSDAQFRFQVIMLILTLAGVLAIVIALPVEDALRAQLLSLIGILLSAAIALSSTTFIGNIMAGIMLKVVGNARPGDFITVQDLTGRITEMGLLHTEIQTEFRDLVTVPNLYMVTHPMKVVRRSGTIVTGEVSLGYDVQRRAAERVLKQATEKAGLTEGFVQVRELGDFSITYRVAGFLEDVKSLISARSTLREAMIDSLHDAQIEIVSPTFMNTRALDPGQAIFPLEARVPDRAPKTQAEDIAFDKAEDAATIERIRQAIEETSAELENLAQDAEGEDGQNRIALETKKAALEERLRAAEAVLSDNHE